MIILLEGLYSYYKRLDNIQDIRIIGPLVQFIDSHVNDKPGNLVERIKKVFWFCIAMIIIGPIFFFPQIVVYPLYGFSNLIYRHKLEIDRFSLFEEHMDDVKKWEKNNNIDVLHFHKFSDIGGGLWNSNLGFKRKSDLMAFKLTWGELCS